MVVVTAAAFVRDVNPDEQEEAQHHGHADNQKNIAQPEAKKIGRRGFGHGVIAQRVQRVRCGQ